MSQTSLLPGPWIHTKDGDPSAMALFRRHYSSLKNKHPKQFQFVGPGQKMVLLTPDARVWRKFISDNGQVGVNCAIFRNENSAWQSSDLIRAATNEAWLRWPNERLYTYVDSRSIKPKRDPGYCFVSAGWTGCGSTKRGFLIFEILPNVKCRWEALRALQTWL